MSNDGKVREVRVYETPAFKRSTRGQLGIMLPKWWTDALALEAGAELEVVQDSTDPRTLTVRVPR